MIDPYEVLSLPHDADAETVRKRYLELVRAHSPERDPVRFAEIRDAYDRLRDPIVNMENRLFSVSAVHTIEELASKHRVDVRASRIPTETLLSLADA